MREPVAMAVFILCAAGVFHVYAGYPLLIALLARLRPRPVRRGAPAARCTVCIAAFNGGEPLVAKVAALAASADARHIDRILIGTDGSTDDAAARLRALGLPAVEVIEFAERRGKPSVLNDLVARATGEVLLMTDARQPLAPGAVAALLENFADAGVGVVSGELVFTADGRPSPTAQGMRSYWGYEKWIRRSESRVRSVPGATGALYAMRRSLYRALPAETILDDVLAPMTAVRAGYRCCFDGRAVAYDRPSESVAQENGRKRRTLAGNLQLVQLEPWLLLPWRNPIWTEFVSHKLGRLLVPFGLIGMVAAAWAGRADPILRMALLMAGVAAASALVGRVLGGLLKRGGIWTAPWTFLVLNGIALAAWGDVLTGRLQVRWAQTGSGGETPLLR